MHAGAPIPESSASTIQPLQGLDPVGALVVDLSELAARRALTETCTRDSSSKPSPEILPAIAPQREPADRSGHGRPGAESPY